MAEKCTICGLIANCTMKCGHKKYKGETICHTCCKKCPHFTTDYVWCKLNQIKPEVQQKRVKEVDRC